MNGVLTIDTPDNYIEIDEPKIDFNNEIVTEN
jgi:hypothetical protein